MDGKLFERRFLHEETEKLCWMPGYADLIYISHNVELPVVSRATGGVDNEDALKVQDTVATAILNFAKTGDHSQEGLVWASYITEEPNVMHFDVESNCTVLGDEILLELATAQ